MAAQPIGRYCACRCGASIDGRPLNSVRTVACQNRVDHERRKARWQTETGKREYRVIRELRRSLTGGSVRARHRLMTGEAPARRQRPCQVCCGMPWARVGDRFPEARPGHEVAVAGDNGLCRGCGEPYAPEPAPEQGALIGSSAGLAVKASDAHGHTIDRGVNYKNVGRGRPRGS